MEKADEAKDLSTNFSNPNILINGDFRVNQRGQASYTGLGIYTLDRWRLSTSTSGITVSPIANGGITLNATTTANAISQVIEDYATLKGKTLTVSMKVSSVTSGKVRVNLFDGITTYNSTYLEASGIVSVSGQISNSATLVRVIVQNDGSTVANIEWVKLEVGEIATPFSPRPYVEELQMCQRYYWRYNFGDQMPVAVGIGRNTTTLGMILTVPKLRTTPTSIIDGIFKISNSPSTTNLTFSLNQYNDGFARYYCTTSGLTEGYAYIIAGNSAGYLSLDAEIY